MKRVLIIIPYNDVYPPMNGGMQRCFHILHQLSCRFEVTAIINQDQESFSKCFDAYPLLSKATIISTQSPTKALSILEILPPKVKSAVIYRWYKKTFRGPADSLFLSYYSFLKKVLKEEKFDMVILENLATLNAISVIRQYNKNTKIVYDAHNVDTNLAEAALKKSEINKAEYLKIATAERKLYKDVDGLFTCSDHDHQAFKRINAGPLKIGTIPNGVEVPSSPYNKGTEADNPGFILFCGALWTLPNAEGLYWFCKKVLPVIKLQNPALKLLVVGGGKLPEKYSIEDTDDNITFVGQVHDLNEWYDKSAIAIAPLLTGSGTRLKILEAMGNGVPVVSTSKGAEGIEYSNGENIFIADSEEEFAAAICRLIADKKSRQKLSRNARALTADKYDWKIVGQKMYDFINNEVL